VEFFSNSGWGLDNASRYAIIDAMPRKAKIQQAEDTTPNLDGIIENLADGTPATVDETATEEVIPNIESPEWTPFVLGKLLPDEIYDSLPKVEGLRRVTNQYVGRVIKSVSQVVQAPNAHNGNHSCVVHNLTILEDSGLTLEYSGVADVFKGNGDDPLFSWRYSSATCETRAESRAYRRALRLRHVVTAEEMSDVPVEDSGMDGSITGPQKTLINIICQRCNIDAWAFVNFGKNKYNHIDDVSHSVAVSMIGHLSTKFQNQPDTIPAELKGYKAGWLESFN